MKVAKGKRVPSSRRHVRCSPNGGMVHLFLVPTCRIIVPRSRDDDSAPVRQAVPGRKPHLEHRPAFANRERGSSRFRERLQPGHLARTPPDHSPFHLVLRQKLAQATRQKLFAFVPVHSVVRAIFVIEQRRMKPADSDRSLRQQRLSEHTLG